MFYILKFNGGKHLLTVTTQKQDIFTDSTRITCIILARCDPDILGSALSRFEYFSEHPLKVYYYAKILYTI